MKEFAKRLQTARNEKGLLQKDLAKILQTGQTSIANYEQGKNYPTLEKFKTICETLKISANWLLGLPERTENPMTFTSKEQAIKDILDYVETNDIKQFKPLMDYCMKSNYDWFKHLCNEDTAKIVIEYIKSRN